jgi:hypothetical protein
MQSSSQQTPMPDQFRRNFFWLALAACVTLSGCSKPVQVDGEVFLAESSRNSPTPLPGVQIYLFSEEQHQGLLKHLDYYWRSEMRSNATHKDYDALDAERADLFKKHQSSDGRIYRDKVPQEVWNRMEELEPILEKGRSSYWEKRFPANFEPFSIWDFNEFTENAISVVSDSSGRFHLTLRTGKKYWVWCSGSTTRETNANVTRPWLFQYEANGGKLILSEVNRLPASGT